MPQLTEITQFIFGQPLSLASNVLPSVIDENRLHPTSPDSGTSERHCSGFGIASERTFSKSSRQSTLALNLLIRKMR